MRKPKNYRKSFWYSCLVPYIFILEFHHTIAYCGSPVDGLSGVIQAPGFPKVDDEYDCTWNVALHKDSYLELDIDTIQLFYKHTVKPWRPRKDICSQTLAIGHKQIDCLTKKTECFIFYPDNGCVMAPSTRTDCYLSKWPTKYVPVHFTSDGENGYSWTGGDDFFETHYPKGFKMYYSQKTCIEETTIESTLVPTSTASTTATTYATSTGHLFQSESTSAQETTLRDNFATSTQEISTETWQTNSTNGIMTTSTVDETTGKMTNRGMRKSSLIALIVCCIILLLILICFLIFMIWRKRRPTEKQSDKQNGEPEMVYSVAYGRLQTAKENRQIQPQMSPTPQSNPDEGFVYSTVVLRQVSKGENPYAVVNDTYETLPETDKTAKDGASVHNVLYSAVTGQPGHNTAKRKTTFRYEAKPEMTSEITQAYTVVDNTPYEL